MAVPTWSEISARVRCPSHGANKMKGCEPCGDYHSAYQRWRTTKRNETTPPLVRRLRQKVQELLAAYWTVEEIAAEAAMSLDEINDLAGPVRGTGTASVRAKRILAVDAARLLAVQVDQIPLVLRVRVDACGTRRRMQAMALRRISPRSVAAELGYSRSVIQNWMHLPTVSGRAAALVKGYYIEHIGKRGTATPMVVTTAVEAGGLPDHAWTLATIDDPRARPGKAMAKPHPVRRRLKALIRDGHGPDRLGGLLRELPEVLEGWAADRPVPVYALPFVVAVFDKLAGTIGPDRDAAREAQRRKWHGSMAWDDVDIDDPVARPVVRAEPRPQDAVDEENVFGALHGWVFRDDLTDAELAVVVRTLAKTKTPRQIGLHLRWPVISRTGQVVGSAQVRDAVIRYAKDEGIPMLHEADQLPMVFGRIPEVSAAPTPVENLLVSLGQRAA